MSDDEYNKAVDDEQALRKQYVDAMPVVVMRETALHELRHDAEKARNEFVRRMMDRFDRRAKSGLPLGPSELDEESVLRDGGAEFIKAVKQCTLMRWKLIRENSRVDGIEARYERARARADDLEASRKRSRVEAMAAEVCTAQLEERGDLCGHDEFTTADLLAQEKLLESEPEDECNE